MLLAALAVASTALALVADAATCNSTTVGEVLAASNATTCWSDSGYAVTSLVSPTTAEMASMCSSSACQAMLTQLKQVEPSECSIGTFELYADLLTPVGDYCAANSSSTSDSTSVSSSSSSSASRSSSSSSSLSSSSSKSSSSSSSSGGGSTTRSPAPTTTPSVSTSGSSRSSGGGSSSATPPPGPSTSNSGGTDSATSDSRSGSSSNTSTSSGGLSTGALIGIIVAAVVLVLVVLAVILGRRRRRRDRGRRSSSEDLEPPVRGKQVRLLDDDRSPVEYEDNTRFTSKTHSSGGSMAGGKVNLWEDSVIVAARISADRVQLGALIGRGGFGEVYRGRYRDQDVAVKTLLPDKRKDLVQIQAFLSEIRLMATMEHPCVVQFVGVAWESLGDLCCVTEFMAGGDLRSLLNDYRANQDPQGMDAGKVEIAYRVAYALTYLHSLEPAVLHRDLKSRNILLTESLDAKITDFGTSRARSDETMTAGVGSWMWMAPEVMVGGRYDEKADVFSFGVVLSELDTHELPYSHAKEGGSSEAAMMQMMSMGKLRVRFSRFTDPDMVLFAESCVSFDRLRVLWSLS